MKLAVNTVRIVVGVLFIFSGLVKANDPMGLSYKMQEFFEIWGIHQFNTWTLSLSVVMNAFEIIAGFALLIGWRIKLVSWLLLLLIVFFTFLTGYTYITGNPKNCGCFGDCLPITSKTSFLKDVALTILISILLLTRKLIHSLFSNRLAYLLLIIVTIFSFGSQWYTLNYLPVVDCLPFKKGSNIASKMTIPADAIPDSTVITYRYKKNGIEVEFTADKFPSDFNQTTYSFIDRYDKLIRKGKNNEPAIKGFSLSGNSNIDSTDFLLSLPAAVVLFVENFERAGEGWKSDFATVYAAAKNKNIPSFIITAEPGKAAQVLEETSFSEIPVFKCDYKVIETAARSIPCIYFLQNGTVIDKYSHRQLKNIKKNIAAADAIKGWPLLPTNNSFSDSLK